MEKLINDFSSSLFAHILYETENYVLLAKSLTRILKKKRIHLCN